MQANVAIQAPIFESCLPPTLKHVPSIGWFIEYYFSNPFTRKAERRVFKLNTYRKKCRTQSDFRVLANRMICELNCKLQSGWTPIGYSQSPETGEVQTIKITPTPVTIPDAVAAEAQKRAIERANTKLGDLVTKFLKEKERETKDKTYASYASHLRTLASWVQVNYPNFVIKDFNEEIAVEYMDYFFNERKAYSIDKKTKEKVERDISPNSYNNTLKNMRIFFGWIVSKNYLKKNPFEGIKAKKAQKKRRVVVPEAERKMMTEYFQKTCPNYLVVCHLVFTSFIRPIEISRIQVKNIHLREKYIYMPEDTTKNGFARYAPLSDELCRMLAPLINGVNGEEFLIGEGYKPAPVRLHPNTYAKRWAAMREKLGIPENRQLYSLRDTGLTLMLQAGLSPDTVMKAADHHDLSITTKYITGADPDLITKVNMKAPSFIGSKIGKDAEYVDDAMETLLAQFD